ncbi:MAG: hypothetical protein ACI4UK_10690, partial [Floccifex sp.]
SYYHNWNKEEYYQLYKDHSMVLNKKVWIQENNGLKEVFAKDIDDNFELVVVDNGLERKVSSGEVHVKVNCN